MATRLRQARPADYDRLINVVDDWWGRPIHGALPRLFLDHFHRTSFAAEDDGALAGFLIGLFSDSPGVAYIHFVGVEPRVRGNGLARQLYHRFFDLAKSDGRSVIRAITTPQNHGSVAFHRAMGFTVSGPVTDYNGPAADRILFHRRLD